MKPSDKQLREWIYQLERVAPKVYAKQHMAVVEVLDYLRALIGSAPLSSQRSEPENAQERSAEQELADRNMAAMSLLSFTESTSRLQEVETGRMPADEEIRVLRAELIEESNKVDDLELRLQEVEAERDELKRRLGVFHPSEPSTSGIYERLADTSPTVERVEPSAVASALGAKERCNKPAPAPYSCDQPRGHAGPCGQKRPGRKGVCW